jgi:hypothetical protein
VARVDRAAATALHAARHAAPSPGVWRSRAARGRGGEGHFVEASGQAGRERSALRRAPARRASADGGAPRAMATESAARAGTTAWYVACTVRGRRSRARRAGPRPAPAQNESRGGDR